MKSWEIILLVLLVAIVVGFFITRVDAATDTTDVSDVYKQNSIINYGKPCFNNGTYCSSSTLCNMTVINPTNSVIIANEEATNQGYIYNHSITFSDLGIYKIDMVCNDNGLMGSETFYAQVTGSGKNNNVPFLIIYLLVCISIVAFGLFIHEPWFGVFGSVLLIPAGLYIINNGIGDIRDMVTTWAIGIVIIGIGTVIGIKSALEVMEEDD